MVNNTIGYWFDWGTDLLYEVAKKNNEWNAEYNILPVNQSPQLDAEYLLLAAVNSSTDSLDSKISKIDILAYPEKTLSTNSIICFQNYIARRQQGEPLAFILGYQPFWKLNLLVSPHTLIPRADTELLVEIILEKMGKTPQRVLDLGTGTGAIALSLAQERPDWSIVATDAKPSIIKLAKKNAEYNHIVLNDPGELIFKVGSWFEALEDESLFSVIVSNPPYIAQNDPHLKQSTLLFEPLSALASGPEGLDALSHIIHHAPRFLKKGGLLVLEHGYNQKEAIQHLLCRAGFQNIETRVDLGGMDRATIGWLL